MTDQLGNPQEPAGSGEPTPPPAHPASSVDGKNAAEWAASYKGLQSAYTKLKTSTDTEIGKLKQDAIDLQAKYEEMAQGITGKDAQVGVLNKKIADLEAELAAEKSNASNAQAQVARTKLIMAEYSDLASFEAQGLLPKGANDDETRALLDKFRTAVKSVAGDRARQNLAGATPPTPPGGGAGLTPDGETAEYCWDQMVKYAGHDDAQFRKWQEKYDALSAK